MRANIHIRKTNQARWDGITNKSAWVNAMLEKSPPNSIVEKQRLEPTPPTNESLGNAVQELKKDLPKLVKKSRKTKPDTEFCTHGFPVGFCKKGCTK